MPSELKKKSESVNRTTQKLLSDFVSLEGVDMIAVRLHPGLLFWL